MNEQTFAMILMFLGAVVAALTFVYERMNKRAADSLPPSVLPIVVGALELAATLAKATPTPMDDELVAKLRALLDKPAA